MRAAVIGLALFAGGGLLPLVAEAKVVGVVPMQGGAELLLHDDAGPCVRGARRAEYVKQGEPVIPGCWIVAGPVLQVAFFDGDASDVPLQVVRRPTPL